MIRYFQTNSPVNIVLLLVYAFLLKLYSFMHPHIPVAQATDGFVFVKLLVYLRTAGEFAPVIYPLIVLVLVLTQAIVFSNFLNKQKLLPKPNFLPAMAYVFITALFPEWWQLSSALIVNTLLVWVWASLSDLFNHSRPKALVYNTGLAVGITSFLYFPAIGFVVLIFFALIIMRPFQLSEWLIAVLGVLTPYYFLFAYLFLTKDWNPLTYLPSVSVSLPQFQQDIWAWMAIVLIIIPFLISGFYIQGNMLRMLIQVRKSWSLMLVYLFISMLIPFMNVVPGFEYWILCALPFAAFHAYTYFYAEKKWIPIVLHWLFVAFIVALNVWLPATKG
ncbi:MAG: hypothetical protein JST63_00700 [Bacteroidetes bacterium]|nr:hypothetical protein [Bacteroidota bacterium]